MEVRKARSCALMDVVNNPTDEAWFGDIGNGAQPPTAKS
jgi:hypothetical protein